MNINWRVRLNNPVWMLEVLASVVLPVLAYYGMAWEDLTSWGMVWELLIKAVQNPVVIVAMLTSLWNSITDPTTKGIGDSERALAYDDPN